jgi:hypothetical protein
VIRNGAAEQVTAFVALLALDAKRIEEGRLDCLPCVRLDQLARGWRGVPSGVAADGSGVSADGSGSGGPARERGVHGDAAPEPRTQRSWGLPVALEWYMREVHAPLLQRPAVQAAALALFTGLLLLSLAALPRIERCVAWRGVGMNDCSARMRGSGVAGVHARGRGFVAAVEDSRRACVRVFVFGCPSVHPAVRLSPPRPSVCPSAGVVGWRTRGVALRQSMACGWVARPRSCGCDRGLEQQVALPQDSYLQPYFRDVLSVMRVGPPLMLVVGSLNVSRAAGDVDRVCSISGCRDDSLLNQARDALRATGSWPLAACLGCILLEGARHGGVPGRTVAGLPLVWRVLCWQPGPCLVDDQLRVGLLSCMLETLAPRIAFR